MNWQIFLLISILCESFGRNLQRFLLRDGKNIDPMAYAFWAQFLSGLLLLFYALISGFRIPQNISSILPNLILMPIFYTGLNILVFKALRNTEASIFVILFGSRAIIIVLLAILLLGESFNIRQVLGTILVITSVILVSYKREKFQLKRGEIYTLLAGLFLALGVINDTYVLKIFDVKSYSPFGFLIPSFLIWAINNKSTKNIINLPKLKIFPYIFLLAGIYSASYLFYNFAYFSGNNAAQMGAIYQITSVLTVVLAIVLLKESSRLYIKLLAAIIGFIGVLLVS